MAEHVAGRAALVDVLESPDVDPDVDRSQPPRWVCVSLRVCRFHTGPRSSTRIVIASLVSPQTTRNSGSGASPYSIATLGLGGEAVVGHWIADG